jgi:hypothetical protein
MSTISNNFRLICEIERALRRGAGTLHTKHKKKVEAYKLEIQGILGILDPQSSPLHEDPSVGGVDTASTAESGTSPSPPSPTLYGTLAIP